MPDKFQTKQLGVILVAAAFLLIGGCSKNVSLPPISQNTAPVANFNFTIAANGVLPCVVSFVDSSKNAQTYKWDFGDGNTSTVKNASNSYTSAKTYNVKLVVGNNYGKDSITKQVIITLNTPVITGISNLSGAPNSTVTITGNNFNPLISGNTITVNGVNATITKASATQIVFTVPNAPGSGKIVLTTNGVVITYPSNFNVLVAGSLTLTPGTVYTNSYTNFNVVAIDRSENVYGGRLGGDSIYKSTPAGVGSVYADPRRGPVNLNGIVLDSLGNIYVTITGDYRIFKITPNVVPHSDPIVSVFAGSNAPGYIDDQGSFAAFAEPTNLAIDPPGNLYVTDGFRIRKITPSGMVSTFAGNGADGNADGQGTAASFGKNANVIANRTGNIYVAVGEYHNFRKITPSGLVTTLFSNVNYTGGPVAVDAVENFYFQAPNGANGLFIANVMGNIPFVIASQTVSLANQVVESIAFDAFGNLFISSPTSNIAVQEFTIK